MIAMIVLQKALSTKRPHGGNESFCKWLRGHLPKHSTVDGAGNIHVDLRGDKSRTLFVAHVDTVHWKSGNNKIKMFKDKWCADGDALGADDGVGVAVLVNLIAHKVPGYYVFTQGEERGGIGAKYLRDHHADLLKQFDRAIAFDRKATYSVITHQSRGRCCSDEFAQSLADQLNLRGMMYAPDDTGVYTDTAEFVDVIPECTNLSAGYYNEHSDREWVDIDHVKALFDATVTLDWETLPVKREAVDEWAIVESKLAGDKFWVDMPRDDRKYDLYDAIDAAYDGFHDPLLDMVGSFVYKGQHIEAFKLTADKSKLKAKYLDDLMDMTDVLDVDTVLWSVYEHVQ